MPASARRWRNCAIERVYASVSCRAMPSDSSFDHFGSGSRWMPRKKLGGSSVWRSASHRRGSADALADATSAPDGRAGPDACVEDDDDEEAADAGAVRCRFADGGSPGDLLLRLADCVGVLPAAVCAVASGRDGRDATGDDSADVDDDDTDDGDIDGAGADEDDAGPPGVTGEDVVDMAAMILRWVCYAERRRSPDSVRMRREI